jgi:hypothetical protein
VLGISVAQAFRGQGVANFDEWIINQAVTHLASLKIVTLTVFEQHRCHEPVCQRAVEFDGCQVAASRQYVDDVHMWAGARDCITSPQCSQQVAEKLAGDTH